MKNWYLGELDARSTELTSHKSVLESLYMCSKEEKEIEQDQDMKNKFMEAIQKVDDLGPAFANTAKSVKMAIDS